MLAESQRRSSLPFAPSMRIFSIQRAFVCSGTCSAGPNHVERTLNPEYHNIPHLSWAFTLPGRARTSHGAVPLVIMMRAVLPRNRRCQKIVFVPCLVLI